MDITATEPRKLWRVPPQMRGRQIKLTSEWTAFLPRHTIVNTLEGDTLAGSSSNQIIGVL